MAAAQRLVREGDGMVIAVSVDHARSLWSRFCGLMLRRSLPEGHGLALTPCNQIHMFFMRFALDVAFVDREGVVVRALHGIRPWRMTWLVRRARTAVELPAGTLARCGVVAGDRLLLVD